MKMRRMLIKVANPPRGAGAVTLFEKKLLAASRQRRKVTMRSKSRQMAGLDTSVIHRMISLANLQGGHALMSGTQETSLLTGFKHYQEEDH